ncbi:MAG: DUF1501 domain-containing protein [Planctomycetes bacterium]|nr:DUF1501 domain-containing protein [Planctomycetota bacterium]
MNVDRRTFLRGAACAPLALSLGRGGAWLPGGDERCLLVLELVGGNDGLNTVIPVDDADYARLRPKLGAVRRGARALGDGTSLHPSLARLHGHIAAGRGAVVHGVGYAPPDRSHFRSRDIWHVGDPAHQQVGATTTGWLGRAAEQLVAAAGGAGNGLPAAAIGGLEVPLLLHSRRVPVPSLVRVEDFQWLSPGARGPIAADAPSRHVVGAGGAGELLAAVRAAQTAGVELADGLTAALQRYTPKADYPDDDLGRHLQLIARLLVAGVGTRLLHTSFGGFDTHARQLPTHAGLLRQLDAGLGALLDDLAGHGCLDRVGVLVHSEFGRRAAENASQGSDHGAAGPVFVFGGGVQGGTFGQKPDLSRLVDGDVPPTCDFRRVYAELLGRLGVPVEPVLGEGFEPIGLW